MSNTCPKCVAEKIRPIAEYGEQKRWGCDTAIEDDGYLEQSDRCRGRQEARAELLQWHTGEPEHSEGLEIIVKVGRFKVTFQSHLGTWIYIGRVGVDIGSPKTIAGALPRVIGDTTGIEWQWREVKP